MREPRLRVTGGGVRAVAVAAVLQLLAGVGVAVAFDDSGPGGRPASALARTLPEPAGSPTAAAPTEPSVDQRAAQARDRTDQVRALLAARGRALLARDRDAFLAGVDSAATALRTRQGEVFDALAEVPLGSWDYEVLAVTQVPDPQLDRRYGVDQWWAPQVTLRYALAGFDTRPTGAEHHLTFVRRDGRWLLGADDDFASVGRPTPRALWDRGPVVATSRPGVLVLSHPEQQDLAVDVARMTARAVPEVSEVWGTDWSEQVVVIVPGDVEELAGLLDSDGDLSRIAAVATAELSGTGDYDPAGDRVLINPAPFATLSPLGRQVVLTHEVAHVATRVATGPLVPAWLAEGFADHVAYVGVDVPVALAARELAAAVADGQVPDELPTDADFAGSNPELAQAYEKAWLAVRHLVDLHGLPAVLRFYRAVGAERDGEVEQAVQEALRTELTTTPAQVLSGWQASLRRELG